MAPATYGAGGKDPQQSPFSSRRWVRILERLSSDQSGIQHIIFR